MLVIQSRKPSTRSRAHSYSSISNGRSPFSSTSLPTVERVSVGCLSTSDHVHEPRIAAGLYGKRSSSPSLTQFDFFHPFNGNTQQHHLVRRSLAPNRTAQIYLTHADDEQLILLFNELLTTGLWYVTVINDGHAKEDYQLNVDQIDGRNERLCLNNCNNHGICQQGVCICQPSYTGADCSIGKATRFFNERLRHDDLAAQCTDLCSGHGVIEHGQCRCQEGWHGTECQLMLNQCEIANCNNRGSCIAGKCICQTGYQGKFCEQSRFLSSIAIASSAVFV